jgi:hypothetical protein
MDVTKWMLQNGYLAISLISLTMAMSSLASAIRELWRIARDDTLNSISNNTVIHQHSAQIRYWSGYILLLKDMSRWDRYKHNFLQSCLQLSGQKFNEERSFYGSSPEIKVFTLGGRPIVKNDLWGQSYDRWIYLCKTMYNTSVEVLMV